MDKGTPEADILCFSPDYTLGGQQKNRPAKIGAGVLTLLLMSRHVCIPMLSTVHTPFKKGRGFEQASAFAALYWFGDPDS
jgi:hypothetical protein